MIYRGGYSTLIVWQPATGASLVTQGVRLPVAFGYEAERTLRADGTERVERVTRRVQPEIVEREALRWLRARQGSDIRALFLARGRGRHYQWEQSTPISLDPFDGDQQLTGDRLHLASGLYAPAIYEDDDLLAPLAFASGGAWNFYESDAACSIVWGTDGEGNTTATLTAAAGETCALWVDRVLPVPGLKLAFSVSTSATALIRTWALTYAEYSAPTAYDGTITADPTDEIQSVAGDAEVYATLPPDTYAYRVAIELNAPAGGEQGVTVKLPRLLTRTRTGAALDDLQQYGLVAVDNGDGTLTVYVYSPSELSDGGASYILQVPDAAVISQIAGANLLKTDN